VHLAQPASNRFLPLAGADAVLDRARLYEALVRPDNPFMLVLFASLEAEATVHRFPSAPAAGTAR